MEGYHLRDTLLACCCPSQMFQLCAAAATCERAETSKNTQASGKPIGRLLEADRQGWIKTLAQKLTKKKKTTNPHVCVKCSSKEINRDFKQTGGPTGAQAGFFPRKQLFCFARISLITSLLTIAPRNGKTCSKLELEWISKRQWGRVSVPPASWALGTLLK